MLPLSSNPPGPVELDVPVDISYSEMEHNELEIERRIHSLVEDVDVVQSSCRLSLDTLDRFNVTQPLCILKRGTVGKSPRELYPLNKFLPSVP